ncbi:hypothetical protein [Croceicoccus bisphenolivorans]|uniref:hypothetical protein n=1 Tax=Croceicoccus bisphenolivorans TaxID=1783232 RepID=UPI001C12A7F7|nr:hypothetical protein [Croceicoccus bisphenolivorans]
MARPLPRAEDLDALINALPVGSEMRRLLSNPDEPATDAAAKDRYIALTAFALIEKAMTIRLAPLLKKVPRGAEDLISATCKEGIIESEERDTLHVMNDIRVAFAHSVEPVSFSHPVIERHVRNLFDHPVSDWSGYFAPVFSARVQYLTVCAEFYRTIYPIPDHPPATGNPTSLQHPNQDRC